MPSLRCILRVWYVVAYPSKRVMTVLLFWAPRILHVAQHQVMRTADRRGGSPVSGQFVELDGAFGQDLPSVFLREFFGNQGGGAREEAIGMGIVGGPEDLVRAQILRQICQAAFDGLKGNPALPPEILARPHPEPGVIEHPAVVEVAIHAVQPPGNPAPTRLEKGNPHLGEALADSPPDHAQAAHHHLHGVRHDMLRPMALHAIDAHCWHSARPFMHTSPLMQTDSKVKFLRLRPERFVVGMVKRTMEIGIWTEKTAAHAEFLAGIAHLGDGELLRLKRHTAR